MDMNPDFSDVDDQLEFELQGGERPQGQETRVVLVCLDYIRRTQNPSPPGV